MSATKNIEDAALAMKEPQPRPRARRGAMDTERAAIGEVLDEAREEICCLEKKNSQMEDALADLHKWLAGVQNIARKSMTSDGAEQTPANVSAAMQTSVREEDTIVSTLRNENRDLRTQLAELTEMSDALSKKLEGQYQENQSKNRSVLIERLSSTSFICKKSSIETETNVTKRRKSLQSNKTDATAQGSNVSDVLDTSNVDEVQRQLCDALEKNARWQAYNGEREQYVGALLAKYHQTSTQLQQCRQQLAQITSNPDQLAVEQRRHFDKLLVDARRELENQRGEYLKATTELNIIKQTSAEEVKRLKAEVEHWRARYEEQRETMATINANYESERRRSNTSAKETKEKQSQIQLLQRQVEMFREDFRAERKEKEVAESEMIVMRDRVTQLEQQVKRFKQQRSSPNDPCNDVFAYDMDKLIEDNVYCMNGDVARGRRPASPPKRPPRRREVTPTDITSRHFSANEMRARRAAPAPPDSKTKRREVRPAGGRESRQDRKKVEFERRKLPPSDREPRSSRKTSSTSDTLLHCPNCGREYQINEHSLLLDHIDICGD